MKRIPLLLISFIILILGCEVPTIDEMQEPSTTLPWEGERIKNIEISDFFYGGADEYTDYEWYICSIEPNKDLYIFWLDSEFYTRGYNINLDIEVYNPKGQLILSGETNGFLPNHKIPKSSKKETVLIRVISHPTQFGYQSWYKLRASYNSSIDLSGLNKVYCGSVNRWDAVSLLSYTTESAGDYFVSFQDKDRWDGTGTQPTVNGSIAIYDSNGVKLSTESGGYPTPIKLNSLEANSKIYIVLKNGFAGTYRISVTPANRTTTISGVIIDSSTGAGVSGATITSGSYSTTSTSDGSYSLEMPNISGSFDLSVSKNSYFAYNTQISTYKSSITQDVSLSPVITTVISGYITNAKNGGAISSATINANSVLEFTSSSGAYSISVHHNGSFPFSVSKSGFQSLSRTITTSSSSMTINEALTEVLSSNEATIRGRVTDSVTGLGIANVGIGIAGSMATTVYTDSDGYYSVTLTHNGSVIIGASALEYNPVTKTINISSNDVTCNFQLVKM